MSSADNTPGIGIASIAKRLLTEGLIDFAEVAGYFADARGRKPCIATLRRWASRGVKGHVLETTFIGNRLMTTRPAAARFLAAINGQGAATPAEATNAAEDAGRELDSILR